MKIYGKLIEAESGYILNPAKGYFSIVRPEPSINLVFDPQMYGFALGYNTDYEAHNGSSIAIENGIQLRGPYGLKVITNGIALRGVKYTLPATLKNQIPYTWSFDHYGFGNYQAFFVNNSTGDVMGQKVYFKGKSFWQRIAVTSVMDHSADTVPVSLVVQLDGYGDDQFYVDGYQVEQKPYATTYIAGDLEGNLTEKNPPYGWLGTPHNSASFRLPTTYSGGRPINLRDIGFDVTEYQDLGMPEIDTIMEEFGILPGGYYRGHKFQPRTFALTGVINGSSYEDLIRKRSDLMSLVGPRATEVSQPLLVQYTPYDDEEQVGETLLIRAHYDGKLEGKIDNHFQEKTAVQFIAPYPLVEQDGDTSVEIDPTITVNNEAQVFGIDGLERVIGLDLNPAVVSNSHLRRKMKIAPNGNLYVSDVSKLWVFNGYDLSLLATVTGGEIHSIGLSPGYLWLGGSFTAVEGVTTYNLAKLNFATGNWEAVCYTAFSTNISSVYPYTQTGVHITALAYHNEGYMIIGGNFTATGSRTTPANNAIAANSIVGLNLSNNSWKDLAGGIDANYPVRQVIAVAPDLNGDIYAGGRFGETVSAGAPDRTDKTIFANFVKYLWETNEWVALDPPCYEDNVGDGYVTCLLVDEHNRVHVGGHFDSSWRILRDLGLDYWGTITNLAIWEPDGYYLKPPFREYGAGIIRRDTFGPNTDPLGQVHADTWVYDLKHGPDKYIWACGEFHEVRGTLKPASVGGTGWISVPSVMRYRPGGYPERPDLPVQPYTMTYDEPRYRVMGIDFGNTVQGNLSRVTPNMNFGSGYASDAIIGGFNMGVAPGYSQTTFVLNELPAGYVTSQTNFIDPGCDTEVRPIIYIKGPCTLQSIKNITSGVSIDFAKELKVSADEVVMLDGSRPSPVAVSSLYYPVMSKLSPTTSLRAFTLNPGKNVIFVTGTFNAGSSMTFSWKRTYYGIDAATSWQFDPTKTLTTESDNSYFTDSSIVRVRR